MNHETAIGAALKQAVQTLSKRQQTELIAEHIYKKYEVFSRFKPLALGIEQELIAALPQFAPELITRVMANHCRRPKYLKSVARGGKRFNLQNRFQGEVSPEEQQYALSQPGIQEAIEKQNARRAEAAKRRAENAEKNRSGSPETESAESTEG